MILCYINVVNAGIKHGTYMFQGYAIFVDNYCIFIVHHLQDYQHI